MSRTKRILAGTDHGIPTAGARSADSPYGREGLERAVADAVMRGSPGGPTLDPDALARIAHFHTRGERATRELAALVHVAPGQRVLDVGGGIGGAARTLAAAFDCSVDVLDATEQFVRLGAWLTGEAGLSDRVRFHVGSALDLPFDDGAFDVVLTQHVSMNVGDKRRMYAEARRVVRPGGWVGLHEIVAGPRSPVRLPVPWARLTGQSRLVPQQELRRIASEVRLTEDVWIDETGRARRWFAGAVRAWRERADGLRPPGVDVLLGDAFETMFENLARNLAERRVEVVLAAFRREA